MFHLFLHSHFHMSFSGASASSSPQRVSSVFYHQRDGKKYGVRRTMACPLGSSNSIVPVHHRDLNITTTFTTLDNLV